MESITIPQLGFYLGKDPCHVMPIHGYGAFQACNPTTATHITITDLCSSFSLCALRLLISSVAASIVHVIVTSDHVWNAKCDFILSLDRFPISWIPALGWSTIPRTHTRVRVPRSIPRSIPGTFRSRMLSMSFEADVQRISQAALDFGERVLQAVVTEVGQPASIHLVSFPDPFRKNREGSGNETTIHLALPSSTVANKNKV